MNREKINKILLAYPNVRYHKISQERKDEILNNILSCLRIDYYCSKCQAKAYNSDHFNPETQIYEESDVEFCDGPDNQIQYYHTKCGSILHVNHIPFSCEQVYMLLKGIGAI